MTSVVISPLIALINDQVNEIRKLGISAAAVTQDLSLEQKQGKTRQ